MGKKQINAHVVVGKDLDSALRKFNMQVQNSNIMQELKDHESYMKPSAKKRLRALRSKLEQK